MRQRCNILLEYSFVFKVENELNKSYPAVYNVQEDTFPGNIGSPRSVRDSCLQTKRDDRLWASTVTKKTFTWTEPIAGDRKMNKLKIRLISTLFFSSLSLPSTMNGAIHLNKCTRN